MSETRRVRKTRAALGNALLELLAERRFDQITVTDIVDRADVGRSTFYVHFADREDLLQGTLDRLRTELREAARTDASEDPDRAHPDR